jgi:hypothetical protein
MGSKPIKSAEHQRRRNVAKVRAFRARHAGRLAVESLARLRGGPGPISGTFAYALWVLPDGSRAGAAFRIGLADPTPLNGVSVAGMTIGVGLSKRLAKSIVRAFVAGDFGQAGPAAGGRADRS